MSNADMFEQIFGSAFGGQAAQQRRPTDAEWELCERMCHGLRAKGMKLGWAGGKASEQAGIYSLTILKPDGTQARGPAAMSKREALVALARKVMT